MLHKVVVLAWCFGLVSCGSASGVDAGLATGGGGAGGGNTAGGSTAGGSTAGGSTAGGSTAGGSTAGGSTAGGSTAGGSTAGGSTSGGSTSGGSTSGGSTSGGTSGGTDAGSCPLQVPAPLVRNDAGFEDDLGARCASNTLVSGGWAVYGGTPVCRDGGVALAQPDGGELMMFRNLQGLPAGRYVLAARGSGLVSLVTQFGELQDAANGEARSRLIWLPCATSSQLCPHEARPTRFTLFDWQGDAGAILQLYPNPTDAMEWVRIIEVPRVATTLEVSGAGLARQLTALTQSRVSLEGCAAMVRANGGVRSASAAFTLPPGLIRLRLEGAPGLSVTLDGDRERRLIDDVVGEASSPRRLDRHVVSFGETVVLTASAPTDFSLDSIRFETVRDDTTTTPAQLAAVRPTPWPARGTAVYDSTPAGMLPGSRLKRALQEVAALGANTIRLPVDPMREYRLSRGLGFTTPISNPDDFWTYFQQETIPSVVDALTHAGTLGLKADLLLLPVVTRGGTAWSNPHLTTDMRRAVRDLTRALATTRTRTGTRVSQFVWGYDLWNEAVDPSTAGNLLPPEWLLLARNLLAVLRDVEAAEGVSANEASFLILDLGIIPSPTFGGSYQVLARHLMPDPRIIYSDHFYEPFSFTHQRICPADGTYPQQSLVYPGVIEGSLWNAQRITATLEPKRQFSLSTGAPFYLGEFSASQFAPTNDAGVPSQDAWLGDVINTIEDGGLSWSYFSYGTYYSWDPLLAPGSPPCGPFTYLDAGVSTTSGLLIQAFSRN